MFEAITAIIVYRYIPTSPNNFNNTKMLVKQKIKNKNHVISIEVELNILTKPSKLNINS